MDVLELVRHGDWRVGSPPPGSPAGGRACVPLSPSALAQAPCGSGTDLTRPSQALYLLAKLRNVTSLCQKMEIRSEGTLRPVASLGG